MESEKSFRLRNFLVYASMWLTCDAYSQQLFPSNFPSVVMPYSAQAAAQRLAGPNVAVSNASFYGFGLQLASFSGGQSAIGISEGVLLTTGMANFAANQGTSNIGDSDPVTTTSWGTDPDLEILNGNATIFNAAYLEFDFVSTGNSVAFDFVFGSEEYLSWVYSGFNDVFGFFLSGPGISGPFSNGAVNLSTINGVPVSVNTINTIDNPSYFFNNQYAGSVFDPPIMGVNMQSAYDGYAVNLSGSYPVQCNQTYHIKIAICNSGDYNMDSGVFIKKGTLSSPYSPPGPLTIAPSPQCEGLPLTLDVGGDPSYIYTWSTGQSGVGLQQITTPAAMGTTTYSVTAEYLPGCSLLASSLAGDVVVHSTNNTPPTCLGINGSGNYQAYVQAGDQLCFQIPTSDTPSEQVFLSWNNGAPGSFSSSPAFQAVGTYCWTPGLADIGTYSFTTTALDQNACGSTTATCTFDIKVVCDFCPISVFYENRFPSGLPLPALTEAGWRIVAGESVDANQTDGPVLTGSAAVEFRAPEILLEPGFVGGANFLAIPDMNTCLDDCEDCCDDWGGFTVDTYDPDEDGIYGLNDWFEPDGDGASNDFWQVHDADHAFCAYGAQAYELTIIPAAQSWGNPVYYIYESPGDCCPFESRAPENQIPHSSISWDGTMNAGNWNCYGCTVTTGAYYAYILHLYGCAGEITFTGLIYAAGSSGLAPDPGPASSDRLVMNTELRSMQALAADTAFGSATLLQLFPNPGSDRVTLVYPGGMHNLSVHDMLGRTIHQERLSGLKTHIVSIVDWAKGDYLFRLELSDGRIEHRGFIKQ